MIKIIFRRYRLYALKLTSADRIQQAERDNACEIDYWEALKRKQNAELAYWSSQFFALVFVGLITYSFWLGIPYIIHAIFVILPSLLTAAMTYCLGFLLYAEWESQESQEIDS